MSADKHLARLLAQYGPTRPFDELVVEINCAYHAIEAASYDVRHPEIFGQLPSIWRTMFAQIRSSLPERPLTVVDYGCGTGFASSQVLEQLEAHRIRELICFDPSAEMLSRCQAKLGRVSFPVRFCTRESDVAKGAAPKIDLLLTNSLLHHLPDPVAIARGMRARMSDSGIWLAGHEPSARYYRNIECTALWRRFERSRRFRNMLSPLAYWRLGRRALGFGKDPASATARHAFARGLFRRMPTPSTIDRIVDLHVAHSPEEVAAGRGLDIDQLANAMSAAWRLRWMTSYSFLGATAESEAAASWRRDAEALALRHPRDGANFCAVWQAAGDDQA